ncbi:MAG: hypothetical protein A2X64_10030 [Ignavibacteria bacterium GWF2_33_9]|nr:MAG: hypothetical protein A2X64_10030 [Ignavibacteria bacterium GWF2_33_9]
MKSNKKGKNIIPYAIIGILLIILIVMKLSMNKEKTTERVYQQDKFKPISVITDTAKSEIIKVENTYTGTFEPIQETRLSAEIQGKINEFKVEEGDYVHRGQELIQLDNSLLKLQLNSIDIQIEGLEKDVLRYTKLANADAIQGIQLEKSILGLKTAKVQRESLLEQIKKTKIMAPFEGYVTGKLTEVGFFAAPGIPLIQITNISKLKFTINITESDITSFEINKNVPVYSTITGNDTLRGVVQMIGNKSNLSNAFLVQIEVKNINNNLIKAGMFGTTKVTNDKKTKGFLIPATAIVGTSLHPQIYIKRKEYAKLVDVVILERRENYVVITEGLKDNDVFVSSGLINLFDGAQIITK